MKAIVQRVAWAQVESGGNVVGRVGLGLLVYVGISAQDTADQARWLADKILSLKIFGQGRGKQDESVLDIRGGVLLVSSPTLLAEACTGKRPTLSVAPSPDLSGQFMAQLAGALQASGIRTETGELGQDMFVRSEAHGPVTIILDTAAAAEGSTCRPAACASA